MTRKKEQDKDLKLARRILKKNSSLKAKREASRADKPADVQPNRSASWRVSNYVEMSELYNADRMQSVIATPDLIDPAGVSTLYHPLPLVSERSMISAVIARNPVDWLAFADTETFGFEPSAVHSFTLLVSRSESGPLSLNDIDSVMIGDTLSDMYLSICREFIKFIEMRKGLGLKGGHMSLFMHNSAKFDGIGLSRFLGIFIGSAPLLDVFEHDGSFYNFCWEIKKFGERAKIVLSLNAGKLGTFRLEIIDSIAIIQRPLADLSTSDFEKTETPRMFTNPVAWLRENGFDLNHSDFEPYLRNAHKYEMTSDGRWVTHYIIDDNGHEVRTSKPIFSDEHPRGFKFNNTVVEAIAFWKAYRGKNEEKYAKVDVLMLANALMNFYSICRRAGITNPESYTTSAQLGLHAQIKSICRSMYKRNSAGEIVLDESGMPVLRWPQQNPQVAVCNGKSIYMISPEASQHVIETKSLPPTPDDERLREVTMVYDGIMPSTGYSALHTCWYTSRMSNQKARLVQRGGRNEVFWTTNPAGTAVVACDKRSMYPSVMANGVDLMIPELRHQRSMTLKGYVDPRVMQSGATEYMRRSGLLTEVLRTVSRKFSGDSVFTRLPLVIPDELKTSVLAVLDEQRDKTTRDFSLLADIPGFDVAISGSLVTYSYEKKTYVILGRINALKMLQARNGVFFAKLPRTACEAFRKIPVIPVSIAGTDIDSRLCFPDWDEGRLHCYLTGEELAYFLSEPTVNDDAVEIDLERSWHGPILGVAPLMNTDRVVGVGESPFSEYVSNIFDMRQQAIERAMNASNEIENIRMLEKTGEKFDRAKLREAGNKLREAQLESVLIKNLLNAGGYGVQAQNITPDYDESSENVGTCLDIIKKLSVQDPDWTPAKKFTGDVIRMLEECGFFVKPLQEMNKLWSACGIPLEFDFSKFSPADAKSFNAVLTVIENAVGRDSIEEAEEGTPLKRLMLFVKSFSEEGGWKNLIVYLNILNTLIEPKISAVRDCEYSLMRHAITDENWIKVLNRLAADSKNDGIADEILKKSNSLSFSSESENNTRLSEKWNVIARRINRASKEITEKTRIYAKIMREYAAAHMLKYSSYTAHEPGGRDIERFRITLMEETANHAIRPWAVSITAKARVLLHMCMRTMLDLGFDVLYCDTDCVYVAVPHKTGEDPVENFKQALSKQKTIKLGTGLNDWSIEHKYVQAGYEVGDWKKGDRIIAEKVYFLGKKVLMFCDSKNNILDVRASGISLANPLHRAALYSYAEQSVSLGDRIGIRRPLPVEIDRLRLAEYGDGKESNQVRGLYANATRMFYSDTAMSTPAVLSFKHIALAKKSGKISTEMTAKSLGERYSMLAMARNSPGALDGCNEAVKSYLLNCKVAGKSIIELRRELKEEFENKIRARRGDECVYEMDDEFRAKILDQLA